MQRARSAVNSKSPGDLKFPEAWIRESNLIEGIDDPEEDKQSLHAWEFLSKEPELTHGVICKTQKLITLHQKDLVGWMRGYYRSVNGIEVWVGEKVAPSPRLVEALMNNWILDYEDLSPIEAHIRFEHTHPFVDGNGRTGRMLLWWCELKIGQEPTLFLNSEKFEKYYPLFKGV